MKRNFSPLGQQVWNSIKDLALYDDHIRHWMEYLEKDDLTVEVFKSDFLATMSDMVKYPLEDLDLRFYNNSNPFIDALIYTAVQDNVSNNTVDSIIDFVMQNYYASLKPVITSGLFNVKKLPTKLLLGYKEDIDLEPYFGLLFNLKAYDKIDIDFYVKQFQLVASEFFNQELGEDLGVYLFTSIARGFVPDDKFITKIEDGETNFTADSLFQRAIMDYYTYGTVNVDVANLAMKRKELTKIKRFLTRACDRESLVLLASLS